MRNSTKSSSPPKPGTVSPSAGQGGAPPPLPKSRGALYSAVLLSGLLLAFLLGRATALHSPGPDNSALHDDVTSTTVSPWGELERTPITIAAPEESLPIKSFEADGVTRWFFKDLSRDALAEIMEISRLPPSLQERLLSPPVLSTTSNGVLVTPPCDLLFSLAPEARTALYRLLAAFPETEAETCVFPFAHLGEKFQDSGVSPETLARFKKLYCTSRGCAVLAGMPCLLATVPTYEEKVRLMKAITRQQTMLLRLHVTPHSDINALAAYWGRPGCATDIRVILQSLAHVPGGAYIDVIELLPPLPTSLLYNYPIPDNPLNGPVGTRDCHWTSFNFFRERPDDRYGGNPEYIRERMKLDYYPVFSDPGFGDVVTFSKPNGDIIHSAVFLADGIVFTKNGSTPLNPWTLGTVADLLDGYSFQLHPGQKLTVDYFRRKQY